MEPQEDSPRDGFSIGRVPIPTRLIMAPMAGLTNGPYRRLAAELGCLAFWTEMISAEGLVRNRRETRILLPSRDEPHPVAAQIFGADPGSLAEAAVVAEAEGADLVDINMACPVKRLSRVGSGAALMRDPAGAAALVKAVVKRVDVPVTVKIRAGWNSEDLNAGTVARAVQDEGAAALVFHGRTRAQGFSGKADRSMARSLVENLLVPLIVSGDIVSGADARDVLRETGAAAVMIGRAAVGNPWVFNRAQRFLWDGSILPDPDDDERLRVMLRHLSLLVDKYGEGKGVGLFRPHLVGYLKGRPGVSKRRNELVLLRRRGVLEERLRAALTGLE